MGLSELVVLLPLLGSISAAICVIFDANRKAELISTSLVTVSAIISVFLFLNLDNYNGNQVVYEWLKVGVNSSLNLSVKLDPLSSVMFLVVNIVSALVHIFSMEYMHSDKSRAKFFCYLSLFTFAMLILVCSDNFIQLFLGWEGVGVCSYLLVGFYNTKVSANNAAIKAFLVNRVGDFGYLISIALIYKYTNSVNFNEVFSQLSILAKQSLDFLGFNFNLITIITMFLFMAAVGKAAQIGLHVWLPDAMEGPTPVSALIHAATMVTAGVFLVVRCSPIYEYSELALNIITIVGMSTAFFAASVALVQTDIKKIIAYSTCSQLGYMFFAAGVGAYNVAMFHLFTHAFFKALLFLGSGSVIHAFKDEQDINNMGGVWRKLPYTYVLMIIGTLALTGFPLFSGFYSKDAIIEFAYLSGTTTGYYAAGVGIFTAFLTSIYSWRLMFKTFHGEYNNKEIKIEDTHESPLVMLIPLVLLSIGAIFAGFIFKELFIGNGVIDDFWKQSIFFLEPLSTDHPPLWFLLLTPVLVTLSIPLAYYLFVKNKNLSVQIASVNKPLYEFLLNKWYFDEIYDALFIRPCKKFGLFLWKFFDIKLIDGFGPDGISGIIKKLSIKANKFQSGYIYQYAFVMLLGFSALLTFLIVK